MSVPPVDRALTRRAAGALMLATLVGCASRRPDSQEHANPTADSSAGVPAGLPAGLPAADGLAPIELRRERWDLIDPAGLAITTPTTTLYTTTAGPLLDRLPRFLEDAHAHARTALAPLSGVEPRARFETYILSTRPQWARMTRRLTGSDAETYLRLDRGGYTHRGRSVLFNFGPAGTYAIAAHETWHQLVQRGFAESPPLWLDEGAACYAEGFVWAGDRAVFRPWANLARFDRLREAHATASLLPLPDLLRARPQDMLPDAATYYAQVWALTHYLRDAQDSAYRPALTALLLDAAEGRLSARLREKYDARRVRLAMLRRRGDEAFAVAFGDPERHAPRFDRSVRALVATGNRERIARGEPPRLA